MLISLFPVIAIPVNYTNEFQELFEATKQMMYFLSE
jgi:hypothetical protein